MYRSTSRSATRSPTPLCSRVCYAKSARSAATWRKSLRKRLRNLRYINEVPALEVVERLERECAAAARSWEPRARLGFLRVCGTGEMFPALVPVLNLLLARNPLLAVWVVTRRLDHRGAPMTCSRCGEREAQPGAERCDSCADMPDGICISHDCPEAPDLCADPRHLRLFRGRLRELER